MNPQSGRIALVTQETSKVTAVTADKYEGIITTVALSDAAGGDFEFTVNNRYVQNITNIILTAEYPNVKDTSSKAVTLTGSSGTANVIVGGVNYLATFATNLTTTATNFVTAHATALLALGITVTSSGAVLTFVAETATFPTITVTNLTGNQSGTIGSLTDIATTGLPYVCLGSYTKGSFVVRVTNIHASEALNYPAKIQFRICHN